MKIKFKSILSILLLTAAMIGFNIMFSFAQNKDQVGPEVLIKDGRMGVPPSESLRGVTVINRDELLQMPVNSVAEALQLLIGIDLRQRGPSGVQADVSIRASGFEQVLILIDGVKMSDPQTGHHLLNLPIEFSEIERIEVIRGGAARVYGQNAFAGSIHIYTRKLRKIEGQVALNSGSNRSRYQRYGLGYTHSRYAHRLVWSRHKANGYEPNRDFNITNFNYKSELKWSPVIRTKFLFGNQNKSFGAQYFYTSPDRNFSEYQTTRSNFQNISTEFDRLLNLKINLSRRGHHDEFRLWRDSLQTGVNRHETEVWIADINMSHKSKIGLSSFGAEHRLERIQSNVLGNRNRTFSSFYLEHRFKLKRWLQVSAGSNLTYFSQLGWIAYPGVDLGINLTSDLSVISSIGKSFRVPTYTELYYQDRGVTSMGNPLLLPEEAVNYEVGMKYTRSNLSAEIQWFNRDATRLIDWQRERNAGSPTWMAVNTAQQQISGWEFQIRYQSKDKKEFVKSVRLGYSNFQTSALLINPDIESRYLMLNLKNQLNIATLVSYKPWLLQSFSLRYLERVGFATAWVLDTRLMLKAAGNTFFIQVDNATNTDYRTLLNVNMPGRWWRFGWELFL